jgi:hypothetical protein
MESSGQRVMGSYPELGFNVPEKFGILTTIHSR